MTAVGRLLLIAGLTVSPALAARQTIVSQVARTFSVDQVHVHRGDSVMFTNEDRFDHQIYVDSPGFKFDSAEQPPGSSSAIQFTTAGTFAVLCQIHPRMHLTVTVE